MTSGESRTGGKAPTGRPTPRTATRTGSQTRAQLSSRSSVPSLHVRDRSGKPATHRSTELSWVAAGAAELLSDHVARGHYGHKHTHFPSPKVSGCASSRQLGAGPTRCPARASVARPPRTTYGTCIETWIFRVSQIQDFDIMHMLVQAITVLQSLMEELPTSMHEAVQSHRASFKQCGPSNR